jgi:prolipoprotein diacylglyceryl transferase
VTATHFPAYLPSPPANGLSIGPLRLHVYGLLIAAAIAAAVWLSQRRWERIGGKPGTMPSLALWGVPGGLIGARIYSLITSWQADTGGHWYRAFEIWQGGLGIWGAVIGGIAFGAIGAYRARLPWRPLLDCIAPAFALGQAIGRWGNYFNQELFGRPSTLPWALKIDLKNRPPGYGQYSTFQPTFLYECIWDLAVLGLVIWAERRFRIRRGYLFFVYAALYTFGRFWTEYLRIDNAHHFWGLRLNDWSSVLVFAASVIVLLVRGRAGPGDDRAGDPLPAGTGAGAGAQEPPDAATRTEATLDEATPTKSTPEERRPDEPTPNRAATAGDAQSADSKTV